MLTVDEVKKVALLARISLSEEEVPKLQQDLSAVLDYVEALKLVNTDGLVELAQVTGLENIQRDDEPHTIEYRDAILKNAPDIKDGYYKVKAIL